jgi:hypothetical protein
MTPPSPPSYGGVPPQGDRAVRPDAVYQPGTAPGGGRTIGFRLGWALVLLALIMIAAWVLAGAFFAILRLLEILIVAAAAGWVGYRLGLRRGRRIGPPPPAG